MKKDKAKKSISEALNFYDYQTIGNLNKTNYQNTRRSLPIHNWWDSKPLHSQNKQF